MPTPNVDFDAILTTTLKNYRNRQRLLRAPFGVLS